jgi:hypothetical protein
VTSPRSKLSLAIGEGHLGESQCFADLVESGSAL